MKRIKRLFVALVAAGASVSGCASDGETELLKAMAMVEATESSRTLVSYGNTAALMGHVAAEGNERKRFYLLRTHGMEALGVASARSKKLLDVDLLAMDHAITAGDSEEAVLLLGDYDVEALDKNLSSRTLDKATDDSGTTWTAEGRDPDDMSTWPLLDVAEGELDHVRTEQGKLAWAATADALASVTEPGEKTLADVPDLRQLATCLGDVVMATLERYPSDSYGYAVGLRAPENDEVTEVICILPPSDAAATRVAVEETLRSARMPNESGALWSEALPGAEVELTGDDQVVRVTFERGASDEIGVAARLHRLQLLPALVGMDTPAQPA